MKIKLNLDGKEYEGDVVEIGGIVPTPVPIPAPTPIPPPPSPPVDEMGSRSNPIPLIELITPSSSYSSYGKHRYYNGEFSIPGRKTTWFLIDPLLTDRFRTSGPKSIELTVINFDQFTDCFKGFFWKVNRSDPSEAKQKLIQELVGSQTGTSVWGYDRSVYYLLGIQEILNGETKPLSLFWKGN